MTWSTPVRLGWFRATVILLILALSTAPLMPLQWLLLRAAPELAKRLPQFYHRMLCRILQARIHTSGRPLGEGPCLIASNHCSWLDISVLSAVGKVSFIAKQEVYGWPIFGTLARLQRTVFIDRDRRSQTVKSKNEIQDRLSSGDILVLFPEGTSSDGNRVLPFKSALMGAAELEIASGGQSGNSRHVPVQPVTLAYTSLYGLPMGRFYRPFFTWYGDMEMVPHLWAALKRGPIDVEVRFHEPITIEHMGNRKSLTAHCEERVREGLIDALTGRNQMQSLAS